jgi:quercetin dioxygenase-like cupin family protein
VRRHPALIELSHHHHHALAASRRLATAARGTAGERLDAARAFVAFFDGRGVAHFRNEEERVFPLLLADDTDPPPQLAQALMEHARLHARAADIRTGVVAGDVEPELLDRTSMLLAAHVRLEERELFPLVERCASDRLGAATQRQAAAVDGTVIDLLQAADAFGPLWGVQTDDLNATLLSWEAGHVVPEHVNAERDVVMVVVAGSATIEVDGVPHAVEDAQLVLLRRGTARRVVAGPDGVRYVSVHRRRDPLMPSARLRGPAR